VRADPRVRIAAGVLLACVSTIVQSLPAAALSLACAAILCLRLAERERAAARSRLASVNAFLLFIWLFTPFTVPGETAFSMLGLSASREGLFIALLATVKCNAAFLWFTAAMSELTLSEFARGLTGLRFPAKLVSLLLLTARQINTFSRIASQLKEAARLRAFSARCDGRTYRTVASFVAILFVRAFQKSRVMQDALKLRAFAGTWPRGQSPRLAARDWAALGASSLLALIIVCVAFLFP